ncbi:MAG: N-acetylmuramoyl-L-alanine amidase [Nitrospirota bacterium]|jgi:N-acetylmuramoyl-L-alanine amidase
MVKTRQCIRLNFLLSACLASALAVGMAAVDADAAKTTRSKTGPVDSCVKRVSLPVKAETEKAAKACIKRLSAWVDQNPRDARQGAAFAAMGDLSLSLHRLRQSSADLDAAFSAYQAVYLRVPSHPEAPRARLEIARLLLDERKDPDKARFEIERLLANHPGSAVEKKARELLAKIPPEPSSTGVRSDGKMTLVKGVSISQEEAAGKPGEIAEKGDVRIFIEGEAEFATLALSNPDRLVVDLKSARLHPSAKTSVDPGGKGSVNRVRLAQYNPETVRVVLDLTRPVRHQVRPLAEEGAIEISWGGGDKGAEGSARGEKKAAIRDAKGRKPAVQSADGSWLVVIDAGHGGEDPGAIGPGGLREKDVALDLARRVADLVRKNGGQAVLTREDDTFIPLQQRTKIANRFDDADAFVSIHLNAAPNRRAKGIETYVLNLTNDKRSLEVAARENGMRLDQMNEFDLLMTHLAVDAKKDPSLRLAHRIQSSMASTVASKYGTADLGVKQGPFWVLYGAKMPSILAEVSFVSHPKEERLLKTDRYRDEIAQAIYAGIEKFRTKDVTATLRAAREP